MTTLSYSAIMSDRALNGRPMATDIDQRVAKFEIKNLSFWYGTTQALYDISLTIPARTVTALIGPSGCGKSTFIRTLNRMNDLIEGTRHTGSVLLDGEDAYGKMVNLVTLRRRVGMVCARSASAFDPFHTENADGDDQSSRISE